MSYDEQRISDQIDGGLYQERINISNRTMKVQDLQQYYPEYYKFLLKYFPNSDWSQETFNEKDLREFYKKHPKVFKEGDGSHPDMSIEQKNKVLKLLIEKGYIVYYSQRDHSYECDSRYPNFYFDGQRFTQSVTTYCDGIDIVPIPYQVWLNYLGVEPKEKEHYLDKYPKGCEACNQGELLEPSIESAVKSIGRQKLKAEMQDWEKEISTKIRTESPLISEHQKRMLAHYNPDAQSLESGLDIGISELTLKEVAEFEKKLLLSKVGHWGAGADIALKELNRQASIIGQLKSKMKHLNLNQFSGTSREVLNLVNELVK